MGLKKSFESCFLFFFFNNKYLSVEFNVLLVFEMMGRFFVVILRKICVMD